MYKSDRKIGGYSRFTLGWKLHNETEKLQYGNTLLSFGQDCYGYSVTANPKECFRMRPLMLCQILLTPQDLEWLCYGCTGLRLPPSPSPPSVASPCIHMSALLVESGAAHVSRSCGWVTAGLCVALVHSAGYGGGAGRLYMYFSDIMKSHPHALAR